MGCLLVLIAMAAVLLRYMPTVSKPSMVVVAFYPYLILAAPLAGIAFAGTRRWLACGVACILTVFAILPMLPYYFGSSRPSKDPAALNLMTANLRLGTSNSKELVRLAATQADVLAVQELTSQQLTMMRAAGVDTVFPYHEVHPAPWSSGIGLWSKLPISGARILEQYTLPFLSAQIFIPAAGKTVNLIVVHVANMLPRTVADWRADLGRLRSDMSATADHAAAVGGCVVVAGDFNSTVDMREYRQLATSGFRDAAQQVGAGYLATFPANSHIPPIIGIDHVIVRGCDARSVQTVRVPGSDHLGLLASVSIGPMAARRSDPSTGVLRTP
jgi:endonuclease/exonuclease/phosphatase (EEP) superfamily protein YafD